ncbi:hypothetical protein [Paenibacillus sp. BJ-4]|uniref:hypothetical protein n=1 Tax=Paenibacillus sp. BJ-4 TaxID=2878097 RepID=UPI001CEFB577|nr:hypothetical protein [Paenibacillus sp. BJ-4]
MLGRQVIPSIDIYNLVFDNKVDVGVGLEIHSNHRVHWIPSQLGDSFIVKRRFLKFNA